MTLHLVMNCGYHSLTQFPLARSLPVPSEASISRYLHQHSRELRAVSQVQRRLHQKSSNILPDPA